ncbi:MAG: type II toxin-antitoxin system VapB family antitoxin [Longimicrobiales bacterium]
MKTTVEIADALLQEAKRIVDGEATTLRALIEDGLRRVIEERRRRDTRFRLRDATFQGEGLSAAAAEAGWEGIRSLVYEGRGG